MLNEIEQLMRPISDLVPHSLLSGFPFPKEGSPLFYPQSELVDGKHVYKFPMPGVTKENVTIRVLGGNRLVVGYKVQIKDENSEVSSSRVYESTVPRSADPSSVTASVQDGVATISFDAKEGYDDFEVEVE